MKENPDNREAEGARPDTGPAAPAPASVAAPDAAPERLWTGRFIGMILMRFFASFALNAYVAIMALYALNEFSSGEALAGLASGAFVIGAMVARFFTAKFTEVIGRNRLLRISAVAFLVTSLPYLLEPGVLGIGGLVAVRFFHGMANGVMSNTNTVAAADFIPRARMGEGLGYFSLGTTVALALGPMTALGLVHTVGYRAFFILGAVLAALCVAVAFTVRLREVELTAEERNDILHHTSLNQFLDFETLPLSVCMFIVCLCYSGVTAFLAPYTEGMGLMSAASTYFTVYAVLLLVMRPFVGKLEDKRGENFVIYPTLLMQVAGYVLISRLGGLPGIPGILAAAFIMSIGQGCFFTAMQALVMKGAKSQRLGVVTSTFFLFVDAGSGLGSAALGALVPGVGYDGMYLVCAGAAVLLGVYYTLVHGHRARK